VWQLRDFPDDIQRIQKALSEHLGLSISAAEVVRFWQDHSKDLDGSWLGTGPDKYIVEDFQNWVQRHHKWVFDTEP